MRKSRHLFAFALTALMCLSVAGYTAHAYEEANVTVVSGGEVLSFNPPPVIEDGYAFFPIEDLLAGLGAYTILK